MKEYSLPEEPDLPMSASERWIGFLVWCRCFLSSTKLILSLRSGDIMPSSICLSIMSSVSKHMHFTYIQLSWEPAAMWKAFLYFALRCFFINVLVTTALTGGCGLSEGKKLANLYSRWDAGWNLCTAQGASYGVLLPFLIHLRQAVHWQVWCCYPNLVKKINNPN